MILVDYVWLDGNSPQQMRSKTKIFDRLPDEFPDWSFDGSSTNQAEGKNSDLILHPVRLYKDKTRKNISDHCYILMCEVMTPDGTPHSSNTRHDLNDDSDYWFGFEQEYCFIKNGKPLGFPDSGMSHGQISYPKPQGDFYCGVGWENIVARDIVDEHIQACIDARIGISGVNAEVMIGQWEYQIFNRGAANASDDLWVSRYLLNKIAESHGLSISTHPKPVSGDWNGSGMHVNISNSNMREDGDMDYIERFVEYLGAKHSQFIPISGVDNDKRLVGTHETSRLDYFTWGVSDRTASVRIPLETVNSGWKGKIEDRRPAANADPYLLTKFYLEAFKNFS